MMDTYTHSFLRFPVFLVCAIVLLCAACSSNESRMSMETAKVDVSAPYASENSSVAADNGQQPDVPMQRQVIYNATLRMRVKNVDKSHDSVVSILGRYRSYIASDNRTNYGGRVESNMTIRIERSQFWQLLKEVGRQATYLDEKKVQAEDVTGVIADIRQQINSKMAAEQQYREILKSAVKVQDILEVQKYLSDIRAEIELMESRLVRLTDQAAYSTLTVTMYENRDVEPLPEDTFWGRAGGALSDGWSMFTASLIGLLTIWPLWLVGGIVVFGIAKYSRVKIRNRLISAPSSPGDVKEEDEKKPE